MMLSSTTTLTTTENSAGDDDNNNNSASFRQFLMQQKARRPSQRPQRFYSSMSLQDQAHGTLHHPKFQRQYLYANNGSILLNHRSTKKVNPSSRRHEEIRVRGSDKRKKRLNTESTSSDFSSSANFAFTESDNMSSSQSGQPDLKFQRKKFIKCVLKEDTDLLVYFLNIL